MPLLHPLAPPPLRTDTRGTPTFSGSSYTSGLLFRREPFSDPPHITVTGVYSATAAEQNFTLLFLDYGEYGASATLDTLSVLRRQLHEDLCSTFALTPADINSAEDIQICTAQVTENGATRWITTGHAMATFPSKEAAIRVYRQQQPPYSEQIMTSTNVPCMVHIAGKPAIDPAAKTLHQAWLQCNEFAGLSDGEVEFGLVSALHST